MSDDPKASLVAGAILIGGLCLVIGIPRCAISKSTISYTTVQVDKQMAVPEKGYLIWGTPIHVGEKDGKPFYQRIGEQEVFTSKDDWFQGKTSSSNLMGSLIDGGVYRLKVNWFRSTSMDAYRNILEVERLDKPEQQGTGKSGAFIRPQIDAQQIAAHRMRQPVATRA